MFIIPSFPSWLCEIWSFVGREQVVAMTPRLTLESMILLPQPLQVLGLQGPSSPAQSLEKSFVIIYSCIITTYLIYIHGMPIIILYKPIYTFSVNMLTDILWSHKNTSHRNFCWNYRWRTFPICLSDMGVMSMRTLTGILRYCCGILCCCCFFWDRVLLCSPGWPGAHWVARAHIKPMTLFLPQPLKCRDYRNYPLYQA